MASSPRHRIAVVTCAIGGRDAIRDDQTWGDAKWLAFAPKESATGRWEAVEPYDRFKSARRNSRAPKILAHRFANADYSIWMDANIALKVDPQVVIDEFLKDKDLAVFRHPERQCLYDEAVLCAKARLDDPETIIAQVSRYERQGFGKGRGLAECNVLIRRHTAAVERFDNAWWAEWCAGSVRDQISFPYALDVAGIEPNWIEQAPRAGHPYFDWKPHGGGTQRE